MRDKNSLLSQTEIQKILYTLEKEYGETGTALHYRTPFQLLVATILAAQSTDKRVNIVTSKLFRQYPDAKSMARLREEELVEYIKTVGLYRAKARNILQTARIIVERYRGEVPRNRDELEQLPGVGRKTANVVLSIAFKIPAIAVDTHVFRVSNRLGLARASNVRETEKQLMKNIAEGKWAQAHHWLIWHGRRICKARNPLCTQCPLQQLCLHARNAKSV